MIQNPKEAVLHSKTVDFVSKDHQLFIDGMWSESNTNQKLQVENPANEEVICAISVASPGDVERAVQSARRCFESTWGSKFNPAERSKLLLKLADLMERDKQVLMEIESLDNGKPLSKAQYDVESAINHFRYYAGWATKITGDTLPVGNQHIALTVREPLGVVGLIVPWNFPLMIAVWKLAPALACGNCCILKPAEQTSLSALYLADLIHEAGFPPGSVNVLTGPGLPTGQAISDYQDIDKISFTGSTAVGKKIMQSAAQSNLKNVSLELGGKSPNIIFDDADLAKVKSSLVWTSFYNSGQECTLGSRLYIQRGVYEELISHLQKEAESLSIGSGLSDPDLGPLISRAQMETVLGYIEDGKQSGARLVFGGRKRRMESGRGYFLEPTLFEYEDDNIKIVQEEIFGPVVVATVFDTLDEVVEKANNSKYALAAGIWTSDISKAIRISKQIDAGNVWVNGYDLFDPCVPFGGFKQSGMGKEMGKSAIELYTREKSIWFSA